jgi:hypothetical protein
MASPWLGLMGNSRIETSLSHTGIFGKNALQGEIEHEKGALGS